MERIDQSTKRTKCTLLFARNGANRPLHQDRQVLRAGDLSLEQATQDAMLARARRYLHGWGVVAGFLPHVSKSDYLTIGPGYGVTPFGDELFLPEAVSLPDAAEAAIRCCGPGPLGCEVVDEKALAEARAAADRITVTAWLIARPASRDAAPRPAVPEDCAHPAATLLPSRRCGGVEFAVLCTLPPSHQPQTPDCKQLMPFVCGVRETETPPLPWETPLGAEANFLVIAQLTVAGSGLTAVVDARRRLWPVSLVQDWIAACLCPLLEKAVPPRDVTDPRVPPRDITDPRVPPRDIIDPRPGSNEFIRGGGTPQPPLTPVAPINPELPFDNENRIVPAPQPPITPAPGTPDIRLRDAAPELRERLRDSVTSIGGIGTARAQMLAGAGITTEGEFLTTPTEDLAKTLNLPEAKVTEMKQEVNTRHNLGLAFR